VDSFTDDEDVIPGDDIIYRAIPPGFVNLNEVGDDGLPILPSQGFQDQPADVAQEQWGLPGACCSVATERLLRAADADLVAVIDSFPDYYIAASEASAVRALARPDGTLIPQGIMHDPREGRPWHAVVWDKSGKPRGKPGRRAFAAASRWVFVPGVGEVGSA
jgi:hypothetical protein